jgi:hypothetical protein
MYHKEELESDRTPKLKPFFSMHVDGLAGTNFLRETFRYLETTFRPMVMFGMIEDVDRIGSRIVNQIKKQRRACLSAHVAYGAS